MRSITVCLKSEAGNLTIIAFVLLVVLTLIGVFATRTAQLDLQTAYNEIPFKQNFYVAEGGVNTEAAQLGRGMYPVPNVNTPQPLLTNSTKTLPGFTSTYLANIRYLGFYPPPSGYSALHFSRYDYNVDAKSSATASSGQVRVASRLYKIGPKAE
jgi:hypothetical protein